MRSTAIGSELGHSVHIRSTSAHSVHIIGSPLTLVHGPGSHWCTAHSRLGRGADILGSLGPHGVVSTRATSAAWHVAPIDYDSVHTWARFTLWLRPTSDLGCDSVHIERTIRLSSAYGSLHIGPRLGPHRTEDSANESAPHLATTQEGGALDWMVVVSTWSTSA